MRAPAVADSNIAAGWCDAAATAANICRKNVLLSVDVLRDEGFVSEHHMLHPGSAEQHSRQRSKDCAAAAKTDRLALT